MVMAHGVVFFVGWVMAGFVSDRLLRKRPTDWKNLVIEGLVAAAAYTLILKIF